MCSENAFRINRISKIPSPMLMAFELFLSILLQPWMRLQPLKMHGLNLLRQPHDFLIFPLLDLGQIHTNKETVFSTLCHQSQKILVSRYLDLCGNVLIINQLLDLEKKLQQFPDSGKTLELVTICNPLWSSFRASFCFFFPWV